MVALVCSISMLHASQTQMPGQSCRNASLHAIHCHHCLFDPSDKESLHPYLLAGLACLWPSSKYTAQPGPSETAFAHQTVVHTLGSARRQLRMGCCCHRNRSCHRMLQYQKLSQNAAVTGTGTVQVAVGNLCITLMAVYLCVCVWCRARAAACCSQPG